MKKHTIKLFVYGLFLFSAGSATAQWSGTNPVYHMGNVSIGDNTLYGDIMGSSTLQLIGNPAAFRMIYAQNDLRFTDIINDDGDLVFYYKQEYETSPLETFRIRNNGNVGIGMGSNVLFKLHVNGRAKLDGTDAGMWIESGTTDWFVGRDGSYLRFQYDGVDRFKINPNGNALLQGKFECKEIKVSSSPTADFVFEDDYSLKSLDEVEKFIKTNKHLPEIASAEDMECNGVNVGEFQIKLLQKIEELTLYVIDLKKENTKLSKEISVLSSKTK